MGSPVSKAISGDVVLCWIVTNLAEYRDVGSKIKPSIIKTINVPIISEWFWTRNSVLSTFGELLDEVPIRLRIPILLILRSFKNNLVFNSYRCIYK